MPNVATISPTTTAIIAISMIDLGKVHLPKTCGLRNWLLVVGEIVAKLGLLWGMFLGLF